MAHDKQFRTELDRLKATIAKTQCITASNDHLPPPTGLSFNLQNGKTWQVNPNNSGKHEIILPNGEKHRLSLDSADTPRHFSRG